MANPHVLDVRGVESDHAQDMQLRFTLTLAIRRHIERRGLGHGQAADSFGVNLAQMTDLLDGNVACFCTYDLIRMVADGGVKVGFPGGWDSSRHCS